MNIAPSMKKGSSGCDTNWVYYSIINIMDLCEYLGMASSVNEYALSSCRR